MTTQSNMTATLKLPVLLRPSQLVRGHRKEKPVPYIDSFLLDTDGILIGRECYDPNASRTEHDTSFSLLPSWAGEAKSSIQGLPVHCCILTAWWEDAGRLV